MWDITLNNGVAIEIHTTKNLNSFSSKEALNKRLLLEKLKAVLPETW